jgi:hyperosmotically inducible periplasmic protein
MKYLLPKTFATLASACVLVASALAAEPAKAGADNTGKNERDRSGETKTPIDQSNKPEDLKVTQDIRKAVMKDDSLKMNAKNVKIITADGKVTLRGPVNSEAEKTKIEALAKAAAGKMPVHNQLEVKAASAK